MKVINFFLFFILISINYSFANINKEFENWKLNFKNSFRKQYFRTNI